MAIANYLQRPTVWRGAQWDGTNVDDMATLAAVAGWTFTADNGGTVHGPFYSIPIPVGNYLVVSPGNGLLSVPTDQFTADYQAGSTWSALP